MKNFDELYKTLSNISTEKIDIARKKLLIKTAIGIPLAILFVIIGTYFVPGFTFFFIIIAIIMFMIFVRNSSFTTFIQTILFMAISMD